MKTTLIVVIFVVLACTQKGSQILVIHARKVIIVFLVLKVHAQMVTGQVLVSQQLVQYRVAQDITVQEVLNRHVQ